MISMHVTREPWSGSGGSSGNRPAWRISPGQSGGTVPGTAGNRSLGTSGTVSPRSGDGSQNPTFGEKGRNLYSLVTAPSGKSHLSMWQVTLAPHHLQNPTGWD